MSARVYAFLSQSVKAYFFPTTNVKAYFFQTRVKAYGVRTTPATAYAFPTNIVSAFAFATLRIKACLPTGATAYTFQTTLVKAHTAPIVRQLGICVLIEDGHRISLPGDECHDQWRPDDAYQRIFLLEDECDGKLLSRRSVSREMAPGRRMPAQPSELLQPGYTP